MPGVEVLTPRFFNEFAVRLPDAARRWSRPWRPSGVIGGRAVLAARPDAGLDDVLLLAATETTTDEDIAALAAALKEVLR